MNESTQEILYFANRFMQIIAVIVSPVFNTLSPT